MSYFSPGFTLIELMVVVIIITIIAVMAVPGINQRLNSAKARTTAEEVATIYRTARLRALGRGSAVMVRFTKADNSLEIREAIQGQSDASAIGCSSLPKTSCTLPTDRWNSDDRSQQIRMTYLGTDYDVNPVFFKPSDTSSAVSDRTTLDICFTPLGYAYSDMESAGTLERMITAPRIDVTRVDDVGLARSVLINTVGPARVVAQ